MHFKTLRQDPFWGTGIFYFKIKKITTTKKTWFDFCLWHPCCLFQLCVCSQRLSLPFCWLCAFEMTWGHCLECRGYRVSECPFFTQSSDFYENIDHFLSKTQEFLLLTISVPCSLFRLVHIMTRMRSILGLCQ